MPATFMGSLKPNVSEKTLGIRISEFKNSFSLFPYSES
jgi:hypothetical protein